MPFAATPTSFLFFFFVFLLSLLLVQPDTARAASHRGGSSAEKSPSILPTVVDVGADADATSAPP